MDEDKSCLAIVKELVRRLERFTKVIQLKIVNKTGSDDFLKHLGHTQL